MKKKKMKYRTENWQYFRDVQKRRNPLTHIRRRGQKKNLKEVQPCEAQEENVFPKVGVS